nr:MAG TPA: hypothetical protein [Caudoviricetes sp.]
MFYNKKSTSSEVFEQQIYIFLDILHFNTKI